MTHYRNNPAPDPKNLTGSIPRTLSTPRGSLTPSEEKDGIINEDKLLGSGGYSTSSTESERLPLASQAVQPSGSAFGDWLVVSLGLRKVSRRPELDSVATQVSVFDGPQAEHYYPSKDYEGYASFDPSFRWTHREEKAVVRKVDIRILGWACVMFFSLNMNRSNLVRATADNFLKDLSLTQADYNLGNTLYRVCFLFAELPHQFISKKVGPDIWLPFSLTMASIVAASQFWLTGRGSFLATRCLLAFWHGGFIPDTILYLSYWYTKFELPIRLGFFWVILTVTALVSSFLAVGLLEMRGVAGKAGWQWLFLIEGLICLVISLIGFFMMPPSPSQTKSRFRPNGWFTDREVKIIINKTLRDDPGKSSMHNREGLSLKQTWQSITNKYMWPLYLVGLLFGLAGYPLQQYFQLSMRQLGFSTIEANLLSIPNQAATIIILISVTLASELINNRSLVAASQNVWYLPNFIALIAVAGDMKAWDFFAIATVLLSAPYVHAIQVAWVSRNSGSVELRTVSAALYNMAVQLSGTIGANVYQASEAPVYKKANTALLIVVLFNLIILYPGTWYFYRRINKKREVQWDAMTAEEKNNYLSTTTDKGNGRLDFRFAN